ncbi:MAG: hypothetical protein GKR88_12675 [Flavobacteriaceae bacterium]|nr:MAG: hypothetical protein GKR88_12675 [Flavobacteriaceae bacterium]
MKKLIPILLLLILTTFYNCIENDFLNDRVDERISFNNPVNQILLNETYQLMATFFNNVGQQETANFIWSSSQPSVISISDSGLITALAEGSAVISVRVISTTGTTISQELNIMVTNTPVDNDPVSKSGMIITTSSYVLTGNFTISEITGSSNLDLSIASDYQASSSLPGLYVYLSNNPNSISGALEISKVTVFSGAHNYQIMNTGINDYKYVLYWCKPFSVKVGHGEIND